MQDLMITLSNAIPGLSPKLSQGARYVLEHPDEVAISSMRTIASRVGVASPTMLRLARSVGFDSYDAFRAVFQEAFVGGSFRIRAEQLQENQDRGGNSEIASEISAAAILNIEKFLAAVDTAALGRIADAVQSAAKVYVIGFGVFHWAAAYFQSAGRIALPNLAALGSASGFPIEDMAEIGARDVVVAMSVSPYAVQTIEAARYARERKAIVVAITDSLASPLAPLANEHILVSTRSPQYFPSIIAMAAAMETIMAVIVSRSGEPMLARIAAFEEARRRSGAYI